MMIILFHIDDLMVVGFEYGMVYLERHMNRWFKTNLQGELVQHGEYCLSGTGIWER